MKTIFGVTSKKRSSFVFLQMLGAIFEDKQRWARFLPGFSVIFPREVICSDFQGFCQNFQQFCPDF